MISIDEFERLLDKIALDLPSELYMRLNGGVNLLSQAKLHPESLNGDLFVLGEYFNTHDLGRYINIYYGPFARVCPFYTDEQIKTKLESVLKHEFLHHMESLAGEKELEIKDSEFIARYRAGTKEF